MTALRRICVFCASRPGAHPGYVELAQLLGTELARAGIGLVYGGATVGLMGALADAHLAAGGAVVGVIPRGLASRECMHTGLTELHVVESMHDRKAMMADLADGFVAMPGGFGTLDELFEIITWSQLALHRKPIGILNAFDYFSHLLRFMEHMKEEAFSTAADVRGLTVATQPRELLLRMGVGVASVQRAHG